MGNSSLQLQSIITLPSGTLLEYGNDGPDTVYFYDANNNLRLDAGDKKAVETAKNENTVQIKTDRVSEKDIQQFGSEAERAFRQARRERVKIPRILPSSGTGDCFFPVEGQMAMTVQGITFTFEPLLSIHTVRTSKEKLYSLLDAMKFRNGSTVDPRRCLSARSICPFNTILKQKVDQREVEISSGGMIGLPVFSAFGIQNGENLDVSYQLLQGAQRVHIDLSPSHSR
jgi:hypothetical protein